MLSLARRGKVVYAGSHGVVHEIHGDGDRLHPLPGAADAPAVTALLAGRDGLYAGTRRGLHRLLDGRWETPDWAQPLAQHRIEALFRDSDDNLWIGTTPAPIATTPSAVWSTA